MNVLDLFSGIGGFSLGLERAGMRTVAFCEIDPYARRVLAKHWPSVPIYDDIRTLTADRLRADGISVDVICGGFPCQDISAAGAKAGIDGERSGLWREYARLVGELRPRFVIVENVAALLGRGIGRVLGDLAEIGYDAEWQVISAADVGAPHLRERVWIVSYPDSHGQSTRPLYAGSIQASVSSDPASIGLSGSRKSHESSRAAPEGDRKAVEFGHGRQPHGWWLAEPEIRRVAYGVPAQMDRLRCLGNAVVPQIPEIIGRAIVTAHIAGQAA